MPPRSVRPKGVPKGEDLTTLKIVAPMYVLQLQTPALPYIIRRMAIFFARNKGLRETLCRVPHPFPLRPSHWPRAHSPFLSPSSAVPSEERPGRSDVIRTPPFPSARTAEEEEEEEKLEKEASFAAAAACAHMKKSRGKNPFCHDILRTFRMV